MNHIRRRKIDFLTLPDEGRGNPDTMQGRGATSARLYRFFSRKNPEAMQSMAESGD